jgi:hypothetical protein
MDITSSNSAEPATGSSTCAVDDCTSAVWARKMCSRHYQNWRLYGSPHGTGWHDPDNIRDRRIAFFWENVTKQGPDDCWPWNRKPTANGYGQLRWLTGTVSAHRAAYEIAYGQPPKAIDGKRVNIDHTCHDPAVCKLKTDCPHRLCCNPAHLEAVTWRENLDRGDTSRPGNGGLPTAR